MIRDFNYVFLDVGNVLFHDSAVEMVFYYLIYQQLTPSAKNAFFSTREKALYRGNIGWIYEYCSENRLDSDSDPASAAWGIVLENWIDINKPIDDAIEALYQLHKITPIAIAANQPQQTTQLLEKYGITELVDHVFLDDLIGVSKPQDEFFNKILMLTKQKAENVLYVGDRVDNDIIPATKNGITPIWIQYTPSILHSSFVPKWWEDAFYQSYRKIGAYSLWSVCDSFDENQIPYKYQNLHHFVKEFYIKH